MIDKNNEVLFGEYCKTCKYKNYAETDSPCAECLAEPVNLYSHKPVNWVGADGIFSGPPPRPDHAYQRAVKYVPENRKDKEKAIARQNIDAEYTGNKVQSIDGEVTDDQYPSATAVKKALETVNDENAKSLALKIDAPTGCECGEFLAVEEVDENGVAKKVKTKKVETAPPDWTENDSTKPGYIKNKPLIPLGDYEIVMTYDETTKKYSLNTDNLPIDYHTDPDNRLDRAYQHVYENIYRRNRVPYITYRDTRSDRNQTIYFTLASASKYSYMGYDSSLVFTSTTNNTPYSNNGSFILRTIEWSYDDFDVPSVYENTFNASIFTGMLESKTYANKFYNYQNYLSSDSGATDIINNTSKYALAKLESYVGDKLLAPIMSLESIDDENITYSTMTIGENGVIRRRGIKRPISGSINYYKALIDEEYSFVAAQQDVSDAGKVLTVGDDGKVVPVNISLPPPTPPTPPYTLPTASPTVLGGVKPLAKTDAMTQGVGVDDEGALWTAAGSGGTDISLGLTSAQVGQIIKVKAVDENGKPTQWEAGNLTGGLPNVTENNNGQFLRVVNGAWAADTIPSAGGASF